MTRPSRNTDQKLIEAAIAMLPETGYSGLSMRAVAKKAGVNLGMFHYHFKNKEAFLARVAEEFYGRFFKDFTVQVAAGKNPEEQLEKAVLTMVKFARDNRRLMLAMVRDVLDGNQELVRLLEEFIPQHGLVLLQLIRDGQKKKKLANLPLPMVITFLVGSMAGPVIIGALLEHVKLRPPYNIIKKLAVPYILSDAVLEKRLSLAMRGLQPGPAIAPTDHAWEKKADQLLKQMEQKQEKTRDLRTAHQRRNRK